MHFDAVFNEQKTRTVATEALGHGSVVQKSLQNTDYPKVYSQTKGGWVVPLLPQYAIGCIVVVALSNCQWSVGMDIVIYSLDIRA